MKKRRAEPRAGCLLGIAFLLLMFAIMLPAYAQTGSSPAAPPQQVQNLIRLLDDPAVRSWIEQQRHLRTPDEPPPERTVSETLAERVQATRGHLASLAAAMPRLPQETRHGLDLLSQEIQRRSILDIALLVLGFLTLGAGLERAFDRVTAISRARIFSGVVENASERVQVLAKRFAFGLTQVAIFGFGSIGAFLLFDWPPLLRQVILTYLFAALILRLALLTGRTLLVPSYPRQREDDTFRIVPLTPEAALFWYRHLALFVGWLVFGYATVSLVRILGFSPDGRRLIAYTLGIGLLVIAVATVWRSPDTSVEAALDKPGSQPRRHAVGSWLITIYLVLLWGLWVTGLMGLFWLSVVAVLLPQAIVIAKVSSRHLLRPAHEGQADPDHELYAVYLDRGLRALLITGAALFLAQVWQIDLVELTSRDTVLTRLIRGILSSIVILLIADLIWQVVKTQIDRRLSQPQDATLPGSEEALKQARLRTLLPIFRNAVFAVLSVVAVLMALSALGVEIGPLIAGAGVVGVAIGFGSQTLVRDVISGIFYLLDDAFRIGEYIQSGSYKGTVESLGFRSVKLRHQRGYIYTVPYGQLGAVENMSRDWVIDKMTINVTYDTDLDEAKKIIKQIGKELAQDPEFAHNILQPLKMQGVEQFGDFAIQLRMKMMTRPGEQFVIRRRAYAMIKKAFDENGIRFAFPMVRVAGREEIEPAAARQALTMTKGKSQEIGEKSS